MAYFKMSKKKNGKNVRVLVRTNLKKSFIQKKYPKAKIVTMKQKDFNKLDTPKKLVLKTLNTQKKGKKWFVSIRMK